GPGAVSGCVVTLRWLPAAAGGGGKPLVLPALRLALGLAAFSVRIVRNSVVDVRAAFFITFARIKGLGRRRIFLAHGVRNAAIPVATFAGLQFIYVLDGF